MIVGYEIWPDADDPRPPTSPSSTHINNVCYQLSLLGELRDPTPWAGVMIDPNAIAWRNCVCCGNSQLNQNLECVDFSKLSATKYGVPATVTFQLADVVIYPDGTLRWDSVDGSFYPLTFTISPDPNQSAGGEYCDCISPLLTPSTTTDAEIPLALSYTSGGFGGGDRDRDTLSFRLQVGTTNFSVSVGFRGSNDNVIFRYNGPIPWTCIENGTTVVLSNQALDPTATQFGGNFGSSPATNYVGWQGTCTLTFQVPEPLP